MVTCGSWLGALVLVCSMHCPVGISERTKVVCDSWLEAFV